MSQAVHMMLRSTFDLHRTLCRAGRQAAHQRVTKVSEVVLHCSDGPLWIPLLRKHCACTRRMSQQWPREVISEARALLLLVTSPRKQDAHQLNLHARTDGAVRAWCQ